jgi:hypothetical protein
VEGRSGCFVLRLTTVYVSVKSRIMTDFGL